MRAWAGIVAAVLLMAALTGCGRCEASGNRDAQGALCRVLDTKF